GPSVSNAQWAALFMNMGFTRSQEAEADRGALERLQKAHIDNRGFEAFFERMARSGSMPEFLSDHPSNESRLEMIKEFPNGYTRPVMSDEEWKVFKAYCR
ncbi:MAG: M48 family metalloprotease, partial [Candidatus Omnitrophica bacterium]|nr:M48 family metalloprotease [Candidatus Omnitrophota bacterium]